VTAVNWKAVLPVLLEGKLSSRKSGKDSALVPAWFA